MKQVKSLVCLVLLGIAIIWAAQLKVRAEELRPDIDYSTTILPTETWDAESFQQWQNTVLGTETQPSGQKQTLPELRPHGVKSFSQKELFSIHAYAEKTDQGIRMIETDNSFVFGRLIYTLTDIRVAKHADELPIGTDGFTYEACLTKDENNRWTEGIRPDFIDDSGAFAEGWSVVVVDITVYNDDAAMLLGENSNHDPYVFRADSLLNIADCSKPAAYNYPYSTPDYFSQINRGKGPEFAFRLEPGEETCFSIGFMVSTELMLGAYDIHNLKLCKTSGSVKACFIDIVSGEIES
jgi:hypothetical protein